MGIRSLDDRRVVWISFAVLSQAIDLLLVDPTEPASEQQRFLLRELVSFFEAEGLLQMDGTVIVAASRGYPNYLSSPAYVCQPKRSIRPVTHLGFYTQKQIKPQIAKVQKRYSEVLFTEAEASARTSSDDDLGERLAEVIRWLLVHEPEVEGSFHDVFLLSGPPERTSGRGSQVEVMGASRLMSSLDFCKRWAATGPYRRRL